MEGKEVDCNVGGNVSEGGGFSKKELAESLLDLTLKPTKFKSSNSLDGDTILKSDYYLDEKNSASECPNLQKAHSVPHLTNATACATTSTLSRQGSNIQRKKTSEASSIPEAVIHPKLLQENQALKEKNLRMEEEKAELVKINNIWNTDYNNLQEKVELLEHDIAALKEDNGVKDQEIASRDKQIKKLAKKLEVMFVENSQDDKPLWEKCGEEYNDICKDTKQENNSLYPSSSSKMSGMMAGFPAKYPDYSQGIQDLCHQNNMFHKNIYELQERCKYFENQVKQKDFEIQRLTTEKIPLQKRDQHLSTTSLSPSSIDALGEQGEIEILRQQLKVYVEDFRMETEERKKLVEENTQLKKHVSKLNEQRELLRNQLKVYEEDFYNERNKRIQLMQMQKSQNDFQHQQSQREWQEYCQLMQQKDRIDDRIKEMEHHGGQQVNGGRCSSMSSVSRPSRFHQSLKHQYSNPSPSVHNSFLNGPKPFLPSSPASNFQPIPSSSSTNYPPMPSERPCYFPPESRHQQTSPMPTYPMDHKTPPADTDRYSRFPGGGSGVGAFSASSGNQSLFHNKNNGGDDRGWIPPGFR